MEGQTWLLLMLRFFTLTIDICILIYFFDTYSYIDVKHYSSFHLLYTFVVFIHLLYTFVVYF